MYAMPLEEYAGECETAFEEYDLFKVKEKLKHLLLMILSLCMCALIVTCTFEAFGGNQGPKKQVVKDGREWGGIHPSIGFCNFNQIRIDSTQQMEKSIEETSNLN